MLEIKRKCGTAVVYTNTLEEAAEKQIQRLCDMPFTANSKIRVMPDVHAGAGATIGTTMEIFDKAVPNLVGVDIGCGMEVARISAHVLNLEKLDRMIYEKIPSGFQIREQAHANAEKICLDKLRCLKKVHLEKAYRSIGTLGGGNHFIEVNKDEFGQIYIVIHSGSRHLGLEVASYYQNMGYQALNGAGKERIQAVIAALKEQGRQREIEKTIQELHKQIITDIPPDLAYVEGSLFEDYMHDMQLVQQFADLNRKTMMREILDGMDLEIEEAFTTIHNYISEEEKILRKGAVAARKGEKLLIPINMRDGSLVCIGKGNPDWNFSAPHGAGRLMSRRKAKETFTVSEFQEQMTSIYTTSVSDKTLDECPMAYKSMQEILSQLSPTAEVINVLKPIYNFKAGEE